MNTREENMMIKDDRRILYNSLKREMKRYEDAFENKDDEVYEKMRLQHLEIAVKSLLEMYPTEIE